MTSNLEDTNSFIEIIYLTNNSLVITVPRALHDHLFKLYGNPLISSSVL